MGSDRISKLLFKIVSGSKSVLYLAGNNLEKEFSYEVFFFWKIPILLPCATYFVATIRLSSKVYQKSSIRIPRWLEISSLQIIESGKELFLFRLFDCFVVGFCFALICFTFLFLFFFHIHYFSPGQRLLEHNLFVLKETYFPLG